MIPILGYVVGGGIGLAMLAATGMAIYQGQRIETLHARLDLCVEQREAVQQSADDLAAAIDRQNAAVSAMQAETARMRARAEDAASAASTARHEADKRIAEIMAVIPPETEIEQCRDSRSFLVR